MSARKLNQLFSALTVLRTDRHPHALASLVNGDMSTRDGTKAILLVVHKAKEVDTCRNDGTTDSISDNAGNSIPPSGERK